MPKKEKSENCPECVVSLQQIEDWVNDQELEGDFLVSMGIISEAEYQRGTKSLEDFRVRVEQNPPPDANDAIRKFIAETEEA